MPSPLRALLAEGPFHLALSAGFFGFYAHAGFLRSLLATGVRPASLSGSSAGALVAAAWAAGLEVDEIAAAFLRLGRDDFWDPAPGLGLLSGKRLRSRLRRLLPVGRFEDCRAPLAVSVFDVATRRTRVVRSGELAPAIAASCAVPLFFHPVAVGGRLSLDGGIADWGGLSGLPEGARALLHHLGPSPPPPARPGLLVVAAPALPPVGPFRLAAGGAALEAAERWAGRALDLPPPSK